MDFNDSDLPDEVLFARAREGDSLAFDSLERRYREMVFARVLMMLRDDLTAERVAAQVRNVARMRIQKPTRAGSFRQWIAAVAINQCIDAIREKKRAGGSQAPAPRFG